MKYNVRCRSCLARDVFKKHPDDYKRLPFCRACGSNSKSFRVVKLSKSITCYCMGYPYPHRYLSPNCIERVVAENTDVDWHIYKEGDNPLHGVLLK